MSVLLPVHAVSNLTYTVEANGYMELYVAGSLIENMTGADSGSYLINSDISRTVEIYAYPDTGYAGSITVDGIEYDVEYLSFSSGIVSHTIAVSFTASSPTPTPTASPTPAVTPTPSPTTVNGNYNFTGPYYDNREVADATVTVTLLYVNGSIYTFDLTGDGETADTHSVLSTYALSQALWNASTALNYTRFYDFTGPSDNNVDIHIPDPDTNIYTYYFSISDFYGMTTAYLETRTTENGYLYYPAERKAVNVGTLSFVLQQYYDYQLMFINDRGNEDFEYYIINFRPENVFTRDLPVLPGSFPTATVEGISVNALRVNSTMIGLTYSDGDEITDWLYINITHYESGYETLDYNINMTSTNSFSLSWNSAESTVDYVVTVISYRSGVENTYKFTCGIVESSNPFEGLFDFFGSWSTSFVNPLDPSQLVASALIIVFVCIGSTRSLGAASMLGWIMGAILLVAGWWLPSIPSFILAGVLAVLIAVNEGKETVREV